MPIRRFEGTWARALACVMTGFVSMAAAPARATPPDPLAPRRAELVDLVRHDCGACHGLRLTGGLGPALTADSLRETPVENVAATILHGRPGTPMPPWGRFLSEPEARWVADQLKRGFPGAR